MTNKFMFLIIVINFLKKFDFAWMNLNHGTNILRLIYCRTPGNGIKIQILARLVIY